jgi:urease gamma subunit
MRLTPTEIDRLTLFTAAELARKRRARGLRLNHPEALALICDEMHEAARDGAAYDEVMRRGASVLTADEVLDGVPALLGTVRIECLFGDGARVVAVTDPVRRVVAAGGGV